MTDDTRPCPICKGIMEFRLVEYVCTGCTYRAPRDLPKAKLTFKQEQVPERKKLPTWVTHHDPDAEVVAARAVFSPQDYDSTSRIKILKSQELPPIFSIQKVILISMLALLSVVSLLMMGPQFESYSFQYGQSSIVSIVLGQAVSLLLWGWALFTTNIIVKYVFVVLSGLNTLTMLGLLVFLFWALGGSGLDVPMMLVPFVGVFMLVVVFVALWLQAWMFYLMYTDISVLQAA